MSKIETAAFTRGYFCAVAALLKDEGCATTQVRDLFSAGGDPTFADPDDQTAFIAAGLMTDPYVAPATQPHP